KSASQNAGAVACLSAVSPPELTIESSVDADAETKCFRFDRTNRIGRGLAQDWIAKLVLAGVDNVIEGDRRRVEQIEIGCKDKVIHALFKFVEVNRDVSDPGH